MNNLRARYAAAIETAIAKAKAGRDLRTVETFDGAECYAYPHKQGCIAFGVNAAETGANILQGIRRPDGQDEVVS
jgi:hypothetical protein